MATAGLEAATPLVVCSVVAELAAAAQVGEATGLVAKLVEATARSPARRATPLRSSSRDPGVLALMSALPAVP